MPKNPKQAIAQNRLATKAHTISVYALDGTTVIGTFEVSAAQVSH